MRRSESTGRRARRPARPVRTAGPVRLGTCILRFDRPRVMGVINNTPDSFSGDGLRGDVHEAVRRGLQMFADGADIVDVGGESTRPGAEPVPVEEESRRVIPIIEELSEARPGRVSVDTRRPGVAEAALFAGASMVNDVSGLRDDRMIEVVAEHEAAVVIMHMKGEPRTMQVRPRYRDVIRDISEALEDRIAAAEGLGVNPRKILVDPGIGFGKTLEHNLEILARLREFRALGKPVVIGVSRKSFIGKLTGDPPEKRLGGSLAAALVAMQHGADIVRVHDVPETVRAIRVADAVLGKGWRTERR